jgi:hypothetical protein
MNMQINRKNYTEIYKVDYNILAGHAELIEMRKQVIYI